MGVQWEAIKDARRDMAALLQSPLHGPLALGGLRMGLQHAADQKRACVCFAWTDRALAVRRLSRQMCLMVRAFKH